MYFPGIHYSFGTGQSGYLTTDAMPSGWTPNPTYYAANGPSIVSYGSQNGTNYVFRNVVDISGGSNKLYMEPNAGGVSSVTNLYVDGFTIGWKL